MDKLEPPKIECIDSTDTYGFFVAEPLERGFGVNLGNPSKASLRPHAHHAPVGERKKERAVGGRETVPCRWGVEPVLGQLISEYAGRFSRSVRPH